MAEGRMLKKNVSTSRKLAELKSDSARLLWTWILPHLDVTGRFSAENDIIKGLVVPRLRHFTESRIEAILQELSSTGLIRLYRADGERYLEFIRFDDFQNLRVDREAESKIPEPIEYEKVKDKSGRTPGELRENSIPRARRDKDKDQDKDRDKYGHPKFEDRHLELAAFLKEKVQENVPFHKFTGVNYLESWAREFRLMEDRDKVPFDAIKAVLEWAVNDEFWKINILSAGTFREKFGRLAAKMKGTDPRSPDPPHIGKYTPPTPAEQDADKKLRAEYDDKLRAFMKAKGYRTEEDIPIDAVESFSAFKARKAREGKG